jgi:outer membrane receptor protein involved in Fe transport
MIKKNGLLSTSALRSAVFIGFATVVVSPALAQVQPAPVPSPQTPIDQADPPETIPQTEVELGAGQVAGSIVVTGSRIPRPTLASTVPITSVGPQDLVDRGDLSLGDALNELPALRSTWSQANSTRFIGTAGLNLLDLRGLGSARTLVLVNNRRHVTSDPGSYTVDVNTIPTDLLERVDVVTGGNSAVYGSDAIAGVVNFVMRRDFEGIRVRGQSGISDYGDRGSYFASITAGKNFFDNRINIAGAFEYAQSDALYHADRDDMTGALTGFPGWTVTQPTTTYNPLTRTVTPVPNRNDDGIPNRTWIDGGLRFPQISSHGMVQTACPNLTNAQYDALSPQARAIHDARLRAVCAAVTTDPQGRLVPNSYSPGGGALNHHYSFDAAGNLVRSVPSGDLRPVGGGVIGGLGSTGLEDAMLQPGLKRYAGNIFINADITPMIQPFFEAKFVRIEARQQSTQPTFATGVLRATYRLDNPFLTQQARDSIVTLYGLDPNSAAVQAGSATFNMFRFNYDLGTRAEDHRRDTMRFVGGVAGELSATGNLRYEVAANFGRTETYYETGGNVHIQRYNWATDATRDPATGQIVCRATLQGVAGAQGCVPLNPFGFGNASPEAVRYVLHTAWREQWAEQLNATAFISGDSGGFFNMPGGPVGFAAGVEYRREDAYSAYDPITVSGATFLNAIGAFDPPAQTIKEAFGEVRVPILRDMPFFQELSVEGAVRASDYDTMDRLVWAWNIGGVWSPVRDLRIRAGYAQSVRAPNIGNLYSTQSETFLNGAVDPCSQSVINQNPNRARNCAAHGIPTTMIVEGDVRPWNNVPGSGIMGFNQGNPNLDPETGRSFSVGAVFQPRFIPGFSLTIDYYNVEVTEVIASVAPQTIINRCYDDPSPVTENPFCSAVFRRRDPGNMFADYTFQGQADRNITGIGNVNIGRIGPSFLNQPFNYARMKASGIDFDMAYRTRLSDGIILNMRGVVTYNLNREDYSVITDPEFATRLHGTLGDPIWAANLNTNVDFGVFDVGYNLRFVGRQTIGAWETQFSHQGRPAQEPDAWPVTHYPDILYHNLRFGIEPRGTEARIYFGIDNVLNQLPPRDLYGTGAGGGIYPNTGRFFYAGAQFKF